jgi:hypothetical protein
VVPLFQESSSCGVRSKSFPGGRGLSEKRQAKSPPAPEGAGGLDGCVSGKAALRAYRRCLVQPELSPYVHQARVAGADPRCVELPKPLHLGFDFGIAGASGKQGFGD